MAEATPTHSQVPISKRLVLINSASSVASKLLSATVLLWMHQYLLRRISPEEYSLLPIVMSIVAFMPLLTVTLTAGLGRYVVEAYARGDEQRVTQIVSSMFPLLLAAAALLLLVGGIFTWNVHHILNIAPDRVGDARIMLGLLIFATVIRLPQTPFALGLYVQQRFVLSNALEVGSECLRIGLLFALLIGIGPRIIWVVVANVAASLLLLAVTTVVSMRIMPSLRFRRDAMRRERTRELTGYGSWYLLGELSDMIRTASDPIILNKLATPLDVACFHLGSIPVNLITSFLSVIERPLMPALTAMHATDRREGLRLTYLRIGRYELWASLALAIPAMIFHRELIELYAGSKYAAAGTVMLLLMTMFPAAFGHIMISSVAIATARVREVYLRTFVLQLVNLALSIYLVGQLRMGAIGSALGTFVVMTIAWPIVNWPLGLRLAGVTFGHWFKETLWPGLMPGLAAAVVWLILEFTVCPASWPKLAACFVAGLAVYGVVLGGFALRSQDRTDASHAWTALRGQVARARA